MAKGFILVDAALAAGYKAETASFYSKGAAGAKEASLMSYDMAQLGTNQC